MSFTDQLVLWLHIGFAILTVGPVALAISSKPRYISRCEVPVFRYMYTFTRIFDDGVAASAGELGEAEVGEHGGAPGGESAVVDENGQPVGSGATLADQIASVERGRIAALGGVVNLIWLGILALMVWQP